jgi:hypothetical protein
MTCEEFEKVTSEDLFSTPQKVRLEADKHYLKCKECRERIIKQYQEAEKNIGPLSKEENIAVELLTRMDYAQEKKERAEG